MWGLVSERLKWKKRAGEGSKGGEGSSRPPPTLRQGRAKLQCRQLEEFEEGHKMMRGERKQEMIPENRARNLCSKGFSAGHGLHRHSENGAEGSVRV